MSVLEGPLPLPTWHAWEHRADPGDGLHVVVEAGRDGAHLRWGMASGTLQSIPVPAGVEPALAALAPKLAIATALPAESRLPVYDTVGFLRHQLLLIECPGVEVSVGAVPGIQSTVAAAFGARPVPAHGDAPAAAPVPDAAAVRSALTVLRQHRWRFAPAVTFAGSLAEWDADVASGELGRGLEALVFA